MGEAEEANVGAALIFIARRRVGGGVVTRGDSSALTPTEKRCRMRSELKRREPRASHAKALQRGDQQAVRWRFDGSKTSTWDLKGG